MTSKKMLVIIRILESYKKQSIILNQGQSEEEWKKIIFDDDVQ